MEKTEPENTIRSVVDACADCDVCRYIEAGNAPVDWSFYCCGMAGIMGFKQEFHESSLKIGERLMEKIIALNPDRLVTDCLSC